MAHRNNQSRTPRTLHHLQDDRLFSLSGGIPPEHFDDLNFVSTRRGRRLAAPAQQILGDITLSVENHAVCKRIELYRKPLHNFILNRPRRPWIQMKDREQQPDF